MMTYKITIKQIRKLLKLDKFKALKDRLEIYVDDDVVIVYPSLDKQTGDKEG